MILHTVTPGQTLTAIGQEYNLAPGLIARVNGLEPPYALAVGQSILVLYPRQLHTVREGESLLSISRSYGVSPLDILRCNPNLQGLPNLYPGQVLVIAYEDTPTRPVSVNGYAYPFVDPSILRAILPYSTFLTPFTYGVTADLKLVDLDDQALISLANQYAVTPLMHLSTLTETGTFSNERAAALLANPQAQQVMADLVVAQMRARGYKGLDVDFEFIFPEYAAAYADFLALLRTRVNALGYELITALAPKTSATQPGILYEGHNYRLVGQNSDAVLLMTYEWGYTYGPAQAVAPIPAVRRVLDYAVTEIPPEKIFMGFPNYAYNWALPFVPGASRAQSISNPEAVQLAIRYRAVIHYDNTSQTPYFYYTDEAGIIHEVWFEDARSSLAKFDLVEEYGFRGLGYWNFMRPFPVNFSLLNARFAIVNQSL